MTEHHDAGAAPHFAEHAGLTDPRALRPAAGMLVRAAVDLAALVEDPAVPLGERLTAGGMLGLIGDLRLTPVPRTCAVPGGTVQIGLPRQSVEAVAAEWAHVGVEESWIEKETPLHEAVLESYWIGTYPVTNGEYRDFLEDTGRQQRPSTWYLGAYPYDRGNHPVAGIGPSDADAYTAWLSERTGHPWRLPVEAEWEYAAAGPKGLAYPWGGTFDPNAANTRETGVHTTTPVGAFPAGRSPFGAFDMAGNVEEYVADVYRPYPGGQFVADDLSESHGSYRVARGGSFSRYGDLARTRRRHGAFPGPLYPVGFRVATSLPPPPENTRPRTTTCTTKEHGR
ncbi:formylglycine-generating enzyme required for sulfatase activity [Streptomyces sp. Amel2xB2]|uniref:formylglycine-generating enzyme family protein n=1 Tax=Streptomyces sp. Amel2xB2 TaxID=1305829 RepID=UPI000DB9A723|nr:SUMF1/EgtB/PvdO family nonheme iron enzyme [Streptomyces sp. Amel2xB2]RAJ71309.1 formylglycine-generating enzyme required for sulfatase activity [Streptomyces sp. Amel2xB2]